MSASQGWGQRARRGVVEFVAIFLGVSLSFLADDWRENLGDRRQAELVLAGIRADLEQDLPLINFLLRTDSAAVEGGAWLHSNWERARPPQDSVTWALGTLHNGGPYSPVRSEYESAKSAGRLQLIPDGSLREAITNHYERWQPHHVTVRNASMDFDFELMRQLRPHVRFSTEFGDLPVFPGVEFGSPWPAVTDDVVVRNSLVHALTFRRLHRNQFVGHRAETLRLIELIDGALR